MIGARLRRCWMRRGVAGGVLAAAVVIGAGNAAAQAVYERFAPVDLTGTWVSVVTEDWHLRMLTPERGDYEGLPLNEEAKKIVSAWVPPRDARDACQAYGAPSLLRLPGRLKISWQNEGTMLQIQADAGQQTRQLHFAGVPPRGQVGWHGYSVASWMYGRGFDPAAPSASPRQPAQARTAGGTLKVVTTNLKPGYLRKNGVPFSEQATVTEYFELVADPRGTPWLIVTTSVSDPKYLLRDYITSSNFKREPDDSKWRPTTCTLE